MLVSHAPASWQRSPAPQTTGLLPAQTPAAQVSVCVQAFPSLQGAALLAWTQPLAGLQKSSVHGFPSSQSRGGPPTQTPPLQASPVVHALPSLQGSVHSVARGS